MSSVKSDQHVFDLGAYRCVSGAELEDVRVGYETYGTLNADRSNAILVCHYFSGNARAAGPADDVNDLPGWWDKIIGPGKALDTDRYFVVCSNSLANLNACDGFSVMTGPASENPATGKAWGRDFPLVTVEDFVHVQKHLLEHLGIDRLVAVAGPSGGSVQAIQWSVDYPDMVPCVIAVISPGLYIHPFAAAMMELWARPITADPAWKNGAYDAANPPREGLAQALALVNLSSLSYEVVGGFGYEPADEDKHPADSLEHQFIADAMLDSIARARAETLDANSFLYMVRAYKLYDVRHRLKESRARYLFIPSETDMVFPPHLSVTAVEDLKAAGLDAELLMLNVSGGHLDGLAQIDQAEDTIRRFLES